MSDSFEKTKHDILAQLKTAENPRDVLKNPELKKLFSEIAHRPADMRASYGAKVNDLKKQIETAAQEHENKLSSAQLGPIDVTAPWQVGKQKPDFLPTSNGSIHPLTSELKKVLDIYARMGFSAIESREIDDEWHMFSSLNFPPDHPARDDYDTFTTKEGLIAPAHTSTMQNRILSSNKHLLEKDQPIAYVIPGRVFRNEDVDARHEHTFHQIEGVYVAKNVTVGNLISVLKTFFEEYYGKTMEIKTQPFYFPFTEPSFELAIACPFCDKAGCHVCGEGWLEMLGCGMIHPNVLKMADIDPEIYTGFAWGGGVERLVMIKHGIEDVRHFHSGKLDFLRQFV